MENLYLIVGLGNPGQRYRQTRHNIGFAVLDQLGERWRVAWQIEKRFQACLARGEHASRRVLLCKPQTYMNASGEAVQAVTAYFGVELERLLVVMDDADLPLGSLRLRPAGSSGGHHGLDSIERCLGGREYARLRVGIGRREGAREITDHVLGRFGSTESKLAGKVVTVAAEQAEMWLAAGIQKAMSQFNGVIDEAVSERDDQ